MTSQTMHGEAMWQQIRSMPIIQLKATTDFKYIEKVLLLAKQYHFDRSDPQLTDADYTLRLGQLFCVVADKCRAHIAAKENENAELQGRFKRCERELDKMRSEDTRFQLEFRHLAARYRRLQEQLEQSERQLKQCVCEQQALNMNSNHSERETALQEQLMALRRENASLLAARDRADERREQLERDALRDMTELRQLTQRAVDEERAKVQAARDESERLRHEKEVLERRLAECHIAEKRTREEAQEHSTQHDDHRNDTSHGDDEDSEARIEELRLRLTSLEAANVKLVRLIKQYEAGDDGMRQLRHDLAEAHQRAELAAGENTQLRERLKAAQRSEAFYRALEGVCRRVGVSEDEMRRLRTQTMSTDGTSAAFSELDVLGEEARLLREEVEWLEKDRRYWMHKVRMQPLLDTKLRLELGLTSEQLARLDALAEQMRATRASDIDTALTADGVHLSSDHSPLEAYEVARQHDALSRLANHVKRYVDAFAARVQEKACDAGAVHDALEVLRKQVDELTVHTSSKDNVGDSIETGSALQTMKGQVASLTRRLEQAELALKDEQEATAKVREQNTALTMAHDVVSKERDRYREAIFEAAGLPPSKQIPTTAPEAESCAATGNTGGTDSNAPTQGGHDDEMRHRVESVVNGVRHPVMAGGGWTTIAAMLREELTAKDELVRTATSQSHALRDELTRQGQLLAETQQKLAQSLHTQDELQDKVAVLSKLNEELMAQSRALEKVNQDINEAVTLANNSHLQEVTQKIVLLRRRETVLLQRLRRALDAEQAATTATQALRTSMARSLDSLREILEGGSTGFVLPPSAIQHGAERALLEYISHAVEQLHQGRLFREDHRLLLQLRHVLSTTEDRQELQELRRKAALHQSEVQALQKQIDTQQVELAALRASQASSSADTTAAKSSAAQAAHVKLESELASWRQRHALCVRRLEEKEKEVALLESQLEESRQELLEVREHVTQLLESEKPAALPTVTTPAAVSLGDGGDVTHVAQVSRWEQEVTRMRSINLALVLHSTDQQGTIRALEADLQGQKQELALLRETGETDLVHRFISAAVREHAALRKQSELALLEAKRLRVQLAATEANYQIACNEATTYKLSAYRLYRRYVDEMASTVDFVRSMQRNHQGGLPARRVMAMNERLRGTEAELESALSECKAMSVQLQDCRSLLAMRDDVITYLRAEGASERDDVIATIQRDLAARLRECVRQLTESREDCKHMEAKNARLEQHIQTLNEELARLEYGPHGDAAGNPFGDHLLRELRELKETVYARAEATPTTTMMATPALPTLPSPRDADVQADRNANPAVDVETDVAIREYKAAVMKQAEFRREVEKLRRELDMTRADLRQATGTIASLTDEVTSLRERLQGAQGQVEEERNKALTREARLRSAYASQGEVAQRAAEHNAACLQDMLAKKEQVIQELQQQLDVERRRVVEQQIAESSRVERLHEQLFRDNNAMVERFKESIQSVGVAIAPPPAEGATSYALDGPAGEQLRALTSEVTRLQNELRAARSANIMLESRVQQPLSAATDSPQANLGGLPQQDVHSGAGRHAAGTDALTAMLRDQGALLESLRRREHSLAEDLRRERERRVGVEEQLRNALQHNVTDEGRRQLWTSVARATESEPALVQELRAQVTMLQDELHRTQQTLADERADAQRIHAAAESWKAQITALQESRTTHEDDVARAQRLATLNEELQHDLDGVKEQNDKLLLAATLLKEKLIEEARRGGDSARKYQQEIALVRRMAAMQGESAESIQALDLRIAAVQREVQQRVKTEKVLRTKNEEAEKLLQQLHTQLRAKEQEMTQLRARLKLPASADHTSSTASPVDTSPHHTATRKAEKGTQMFTADPTAVASVTRTQTQAVAGSPQRTSSARRDDRTRVAAGSSSPSVTLVDPEVALMEPQLVAILQRAVQKHQRDNLEQISVLRSKLHRCENDLDEARAHLKAERKTVRSLRSQLLTAQDAQEKLAADHAREVARLVQTRVQLPTATPPNDGNAIGQKEAEARRQVEKLEHIVKVQQEKLRMLQSTAATQSTKLPVLPPPPQAQMQPVTSDAIPMRQHIQTVMKLESTIDELRRQLQVEAVARETTLQLRLTHLTRTLHSVLQDFAVTQHCSVEKLREQYKLIDDSASETMMPKSIHDLEVELLRKSNALLDMQFSYELQEIKLSRLQRHLNSLLTAQPERTTDLAGEAAKTRSARYRAQQNELEQLHALVENLQLVIRKLQAEKAELMTGRGGRTKEEAEAQQTSAQRQIHVLRAERRQLRNQLTGRVSHGVSASRHRSEREADLERQLHAAQATAQQYLLELHEWRARATQARSMPGPPRVMEDSSESDRRAVQPLPPTTDSTSRENDATSSRSSSTARRGTTSSHTQLTPPPLPPSPVSTVGNTSARHQRDTATTGTGESAAHDHQHLRTSGGHRALLHSDMPHHRYLRP